MINSEDINLLKEKIRNIEEKINKIEKLLQNHRHDGHGYCIKTE
jgi:RNA polymerase-binding transcription factor DksA